MAAIVYLTVIRRQTLFNCSVLTDVGGPAADVTRRSAIKREEDLFYSDVKFKSTRSRDHPLLVNDEHAETTDDVTYSAVAVGHQRPKGDEEMYAKVIRTRPSHL
ncbi:uncharacterized protein ACJ7VT_020295 [Polymixia lowei]